MTSYNDQLKGKNNFFGSKIMVTIECGESETLFELKNKIFLHKI